MQNHDDGNKTTTIKNGCNKGSEMYCQQEKFIYVWWFKS